MEIILFILYLFGLFILFFRSKFFTVEGVKKLLLFFFWILKLIACICFYLIFNYHVPDKDAGATKDFFNSSAKLYWLHQREPALFMDFMLGKSSNSEKYKEEAEKIGKKWYSGNENSLINDNRNVIRINTLLQFISFRCYSVHLLFMCFLSFVGSILLFKAFPKQGKKQIYAATVACFLIPSLLFWSVGILKEPLIVLGLGGFLFYFREITAKFSPLSLLLVILSSLLLLCVKIEIFVLVLPMVLVFFWCQQKQRHIVLKYIAAIVFLSGFCLLSHLCFPEKQMDVVHAVTAQNQQFHNMPAKNSYFAAFNTPHLDGSIESLVKNIPLAVYNCITKPFAYPIDSFAKACMDIETVFLALLLAVCLIFGNYKRFSRNNFAIFATIVCIYGFILIGLTTHDMETIMRYKSLFLPFYVYGLIHLLDTDKVLFVFKFRKRRAKKNFDPLEDFEQKMTRMARGR